MKKIFTITLLMLLFLVVSLTGVEAQSMLEIDRADARIEGGRWEDVTDGWFDKELYPLDTVEVEVRVENLFDREDTRERIRDVELELYIEGLGSGSRSYVEQTTRIGTISPERRSTGTLSFEIPFDVYEGYHLAEIFVSGRDGNGTLHSDEMDFDIDVFRNYNDLYLRTLELTRTRLSCTNTRTNLDVDLYNIGANDQEDVRVRVVNDELDIDRDESGLSLRSVEYDSRRAQYHRTFSLNIPEDAEPGFYYLDVIIYIDDEEFMTEQLEIEILECSETDSDEDDEGGIVIVDPDDQEPTVPPQTGQPPKDEAEDDDTVYLVLLGALNVILLIGVITLIVTVAGGKGRPRRSRFY